MLDSKHLSTVETLFQHAECINFSQYMTHALYHPTFGYYMNPGVFGENGDFITAPMISDVLAKCIVAWLKTQGVSKVLEIAPGNGQLAQQIMEKSDFIDCYYLLDKNNQASMHLAGDQRFKWLSKIPDVFEGAVIANEWLDALPFRRFCWSKDKGLQEFMVALNDGEMRMILEQVEDIALMFPELEKYTQNWPSPYLFEHHEGLSGVLNCLSGIKGPVLLIDYGYEESLLYHPDHCLGTMICAKNHKVVPFSLRETGTMDITAAVNWTRVKSCLQNIGFSLENYGPQTDFIHAYWDLSQSINLSSPLINPHEMGQYIKVLAMCR